MTVNASVLSCLTTFAVSLLESDSRLQSQVSGWRLWLWESWPVMLYYAVRMKRYVGSRRRGDKDESLAEESKKRKVTSLRLWVDVLKEIYGHFMCIYTHILNQVCKRSSKWDKNVYGFPEEWRLQTWSYFSGKQYNHLWVNFFKFTGAPFEDVDPREFCWGGESWVFWVNALSWEQLSW